MNTPSDHSPESTPSVPTTAASTIQETAVQSTQPKVADDRAIVPTSHTAKSPDKSAEFWESATGLVTGMGEVVGSTMLQTGKAALDTAAGVGQAIGSTATHTSKMVVDAATGISGVIGNTTAHTSKAALETAIGVGEIISTTAAHTGKTLVDLAANTSSIAVKQTQHWLEQTTQGTGYAIDFVGSSPLVNKVFGAFKLDWLVGITNQVDVVKAETAVRELQQKYPNESPSQIAHRIMLEKSIYAGGSGLVSSLLPGEAIALFAVDLAATTALQAEMVYQIAAAYGLDLKDPARKGEVLAVFGLALGGSRAIKAGLVFLRNVPVAGALIGAGSNAAMLYSLGYAACRFYEAKLNPAVEETSTATLEDIKRTSERYLEVATAQEALTDQILAHMILASHPEKSWEDILPNLQSLNFTPASLETIASNIQSPQPLGALLDQLNQDFAPPLLARCYKIAQLDGDISPAEAKILTAITEKFDLDLDRIKSVVTK